MNADFLQTTIPDLLLAHALRSVPCRRHQKQAARRRQCSFSIAFNLRPLEPEGIENYQTSPIKHCRDLIAVAAPKPERMSGNMAQCNTMTTMVSEMDHCRQSDAASVCCMVRSKTAFLFECQRAGADERPVIRAHAFRVRAQSRWPERKLAFLQRRSPVDRPA